MSAIDKEKSGTTEAKDRRDVNPKVSGKTQPNPDDIYVTDNPRVFEGTIKGRRKFYHRNLEKEWANLKARLYKTKKGEWVLRIGGLEVMRGFELPYMHEIAKTVVSRGGRVLNVGFGLGIIDQHIESLRGAFGVTEHHIIELNRDVMAWAKAWREDQPAKQNIFLHQGDWKQVLEQLKKRGVVFDGIAYDAFPLKAKDLHRDVVPFLKAVIDLKLIRENSGVITFYMDSMEGFGKNFKKYIESLGIRSAEVTRVEVTLPEGGNQYWRVPYFFTPELSQVVYHKK